MKTTRYFLMMVLAITIMFSGSVMAKPSSGGSSGSKDKIMNQHGKIANGDITDIKVNGGIDIDKSIKVVDKSIKVDIDKSIKVVTKDSLKDNIFQDGEINNTGKINSDNPVTIKSEVKIPLMSAPTVEHTYIAPPNPAEESITRSRFAEKYPKTTTPKKLLKKANCEGNWLFLGLVPNWGKHYEIEIEDELAGLDPIKNKADVTIDLSASKKENIFLPEGAIFVGEAHGWTKDFTKDEDQYASACAYKLSKLGANTFYGYGFNDHVNEAESAVFNASGAVATSENNGTTTGGFGGTKSYVSDRAKGRVIGYYIPPTSTK